MQVGNFGMSQKIFFSRFKCLIILCMVFTFSHQSVATDREPSAKKQTRSKSTAKKKSSGIQERTGTASNKQTTGALISKKRTVGDLLKGYKELQKQQLSVPISTLQKPKAPRPVPISAVAPMKSQALFQQEDQNEAELEKLLDKEIDELYKLTQRYKKSPNRGELWLRLAELYVEKARLFSYRSQAKFDKDIADWEAGGRKGKAPKLNLSVAKSYNKKAIQLYEWFLNDFPRDPKIDQALFFLGYNYVEMDQVSKGVTYYEKLTSQFPKSPYVSESHFALGEYYFDNQKWDKAAQNFKRVLQIQTARLYSFALYKLGWCYYRQGKVEAAIKSLEQVIYHSRKQVQISKTQGLKSINRIRLASEALKDIVPFYAEVRDHLKAKQYFLEMGGEKALFPLLERLAYVYSDSGKQEPARYVFKQLLSMRPTAPKAFDYQYQIVQNYSSRGDRNIYRSELYNWVKEYGMDGEWAQANKNDPEMIKRAFELRETTLRNHVLQYHQTAQNSRAPLSQKLAKEGYEIYLRTFPKTEKYGEMRFFYGELLYDMKDYNAAFDQYDWVAENSNKENKYVEQAVLNAVLASEKNLPTDDDVRKKSGDSLEPLPYGEAEKKFIAAAERYFKTFPKGEKVADVRFKLGRIAYTYNHFDEALVIFQDIVKKYPKTQYATYSANLILDIYNLKKDYEGLAKVGTELLQSPELVSAGVGVEIKDAVERANFKKAQDLEVAKDYEGSAKQYDIFSKKYPSSKLAPSARYNAAVNYERAGLIIPAIAGYKAVVDNRDKKNPASADVRKKSQRLLARLYEVTGQYEKAAIEFERYAKDWPKDQYEDESYYNAAVLWDGLGSYSRAILNFDKYYQVSKKLDQRREALFEIARVQEKRGSFSAAITFYQQYIEAAPRDHAKIISAHYKIATLSSKLGRASKAKEWFEKTIGVHRRLTGGKGIGTSEAAEAKFELTKPLVSEFKNLRIPADPAKQGSVVKRKLDLVTRIANEMGEVIKYDDGNYVIAALATTGQTYEHMSRALYDSPKPKGLTLDELKQYDTEIDKIAAPLKQTAIDNYKRAVDKAFEIQFYNDWMYESMNALNRYDKALYPDSGERVSDMREIDMVGL